MPTSALYIQTIPLSAVLFFVPAVPTPCHALSMHNVLYILIPEQHTFIHIFYQFA